MIHVFQELAVKSLGRNIILQLLFPTDLSSTKQSFPSPPQLIFLALAQNFYFSVFHHHRHHTNTTTFRIFELFQFPPPPTPHLYCFRCEFRQGQPTTVFCKISVRRSKYCLEFSITQGQDQNLLNDRSIQVLFSKLI